MSRRRLLLMSYDFPPACLWGVARHVAMLGQGMATHFVTQVATRSRGCPEGATVISSTFADRHLIESRFQPLDAYVDFEYLMAWNMLFADKIARHYKASEDTPDLVHNHTWMTFPAALQIKRRFGARLVSTLHFLERQYLGLDDVPTLPDFDDILAIERQIMDCSDFLIVFGEQHRRFVQGQCGAPAEKLVLIPHGVDLGALSKWRAKPGRDDDLLHINFVGRVVAEKGIRELLRAVDVLHATHPSVLLHVVGDGRLCRALKHRDYVIFHGMLPHDEIMALHSRAHIFCLPSYTETFGLAVLEAMVSGLPIVTSRGDMVERLLEDDEALFVDLDNDADEQVDPAQLANVLERLIESPALRERLGTRAAQAATHYSGEAMLARTRELYERALDKEKA